MEFEIFLVGAEESQSRLKHLGLQMEPVATETIENQLKLITAFLEGEVKLRTPTDTDVLRSSIFGEVRTTGVAVEGIVSTPLPYGPPIESGRRPGGKPPPYRALLGWVQRTFNVDKDEAKGIAIATAKNIGKWGFVSLKYQNKQQMFHDAWHENIGRIQQLLEEIGVHVSRELLRQL